MASRMLTPELEAHMDAVRSYAYRGPAVDHHTRAIESSEAHQRVEALCAMLPAAVSEVVRACVAALELHIGLAYVGSSLEARMQSSYRCHQVLRVIRGELAAMA